MKEGGEIIELVDLERIQDLHFKTYQFENTPNDKMRAGTPLEKDILARKMLLNLTLNDEKAPSFIWKEPFASLVKAIEMSSGAEPAHNFELLSSIADWLFANKIADAFRLPKLDTETLHLQRLQPSYTY